MRLRLRLRRNPISVSLVVFADFVGKNHQRDNLVAPQNTVEYHPQRR
jgi:hypothetical protein